MTLPKIVKVWPQVKQLEDYEGKKILIFQTDIINAIIVTKGT